MKTRRSVSDDLRKKAEQSHKRRGLAEAAALYEQAASAMSREQRYEEAAEMLSAALSGNARNGEHSSRQQRELRRLLAETLRAARRMPAAISEYEEYLKGGTPDAASLRTLSDLYVAVGKPMIAVERLRRAIDRCIAEGDVAAAADAAGRVVELIPDSIEAAQQYAGLLRNIQDARLVHALDRLAEFYQAGEKLAQEVAVRCEILSLEPSREDVKSRLVSLYTRILEMDPHDDDAWHGLRTVDSNLAEQIAVLLMDEVSDKQTRSKAG